MTKHDFCIFHTGFLIRFVLAVTVAITIGTLTSRIHALRSTTEAAPVPLTLSVSPTAIVGGNQATVTILLSAPAATNVEITLKSLNTAVAQFAGALGTAGTSQIIPQGSITATFPARTFGVATRTDVRLQATSGGNTAETTLTVNPASVKTLTISPTKVLGGNGTRGTVTLDGLAPTNTGASIQLSQIREAASRTNTTNNLQQLSVSSLAATIPSSVTVPPGSSTVTFSIGTVPVAADTSVRITARRSDSSVREAATGADGTSNTITFGESTAPTATATLTVSTPVLSKLLLNPSSVPGGTGVIGSVVLTGKAPSGGFPVSLLSSSDSNSWASSNVATVPESITVAAGADRQDFKITTKTTSTAQSVRIVAAVNLNNLQQIGVALHNLSDGSSNTISIGQPDGSVRISPVATATLSITPTPAPFTIAVLPTQVVGGGAVAITLTLQPTSSSSTGPINLTSNHPELLVTPTSFPPGSGNQLSIGPQTVSVNAGTNFASVNQNVTITATGSGSSASTTLLINQTPPIASFTLRPTTVSGGANVIAQFQLVSSAPGPVTVSLTTDHPELITLPPTVSVPKSLVPSPFTFKTSPTTAPVTVTITASAGNQTIPVSLSVVP